MDQHAFETDVWETINEGLFTDQVGSLDDTSEGFTGIVTTIGETRLGTLFGAEETVFGQRYVYRFDTYEEQAAWFDVAARD